jgi:hypothetical protein
VKKKMISLWKKQAKVGKGEGVILTRRGTAQVPLPPPSTPLLPVRATRLRIGLFFNYAGMRTKGRAMMPVPLVNGRSQTAVPFQFPFIVLLHA